MLAKYKRASMPLLHKISLEEALSKQTQETTALITHTTEKQLDGGKKICDLGFFGFLFIFIYFKLLVVIIVNLNR